MRFLMLNWRDPRNPGAGGAERVSFAFMKGLLERGHQIDWFTFTFPGGAPEEDIEGIRVIRRGGVLTSLLAAWRWYRRQARYDLVIDQHHGIPWFAPWWCRTRCLAYIHEVLGPIWGSFYRGPMRYLGPWQERMTHWFYRKVPFWVPSESTRTALRRHGVRTVHVLPNGVDVEPLPQLPPKTIESPLRLIAVSRLAPNKRVDHAIRTVEALRRRGIEAQLTVVGTGLTEERLRALTRELGLNEHISLVGYQPEEAKARLLQESHLLLHPSVREGWGLNVIEANALGTPAVVYPVDGLVDSTIHEETGYVCRGESPELMADGVAWVVADGGRYQGMRERAWRRSWEYQWHRVIPRVCEFLESQALGEKLV